jgi:hypothetical protein
MGDGGWTVGGGVEGEVLGANREDGLIRRNALDVFPGFGGNRHWQNP